jgi:hypothetical protein
MSVVRLNKASKTSARIAGIPVDIRTEHHQNSSQCRYRHTDLFKK